MFICLWYIDGTFAVYFEQHMTNHLGYFTIITLVCRILSSNCPYEKDDEIFDNQKDGSRESTIENDLVRAVYKK